MGPTSVKVSRKILMKSTLEEEGVLSKTDYDERTEPTILVIEI